MLLKYSRNTKKKLKKLYNVIKEILDYIMLFQDITFALFIGLTKKNHFEIKVALRCQPFITASIKLTNAID